MYEHIALKLQRGETIILDGGTGTDIQRRGAPMSGDTWCAEVNLTHPAIVRAVHEDYIAVGADVITANTFATSALLFNALSRDDELLDIDRAAVGIAREAAEGRPVAVAGSISTMRPLVVGTDRNANSQRAQPGTNTRRRRSRMPAAISGAATASGVSRPSGPVALWRSRANARLSRPRSTIGVVTQSGWMQVTSTP